MTPHLLDHLRQQLRSDPSDGEVALVIGIAVRDPLVIHTAERIRLAQLARTASQGPRDLLVAEASKELLTQPTPSHGLRRPASGMVERVDPARLPQSQQGTDEAVDLPGLKGWREAETEPPPGER